MPTLNYSRVTAAGNGWTRVETPDGRSFTVKGDRAMRNNNPGNIEYGKYARSKGAIGTDGRFAVFPSRETGVRAQSGLLFGKNYKDLTLAEAIAKYAPEFENNTAAYAATVAAMSGVSLDTKMEDIPADKRTAVVDAMHYVEGNTKAHAYDDETGTLAYTLDGKKSALPEVMDNPPLSLADTQLRDEAVARQAQQYAQYRPGTVPQPPPSMPSRPLSLTPDVALNKYAPPSRLAPVSLGKVTRAPLEALPASLPAAPVGRVERAPLGPVGQFAAPARSLQHPVSVAKPAPLAPAPVSPVTKGPALAPATPNAQTLAAQYAQYQPSKAVSMPTVAGMPSIPAPTGLPAAKPAQPLQHPVSVPAMQAPPAAILAPALAPPKAVRDYPVADIPAAPAPTAYDVYSGLATQAKDNTGKNTVGMLPDGTTTVTNQWGVTTGMTPYGKQTAVGSLPGIAGPVKGALPGIAGSMLGGYLGGPLGAIAGGLLGKAFAQPGGLFAAPSRPVGGIRSFNADGSINTRGGGHVGMSAGERTFPDAPGRPGSGRTVSRSEMAGIVGGGGGLY